MSRIADALPQEPVKVEQRRRAQRVDVVLVVESIEHLHDWNQRVAFAKLERPLQAPIKRKVFVVLAQRIAVGGRSNLANATR